MNQIVKHQKQETILKLHLAYQTRLTYLNHGKELQKIYQNQNWEILKNSYQYNR